MMYATRQSTFTKPKIRCQVLVDSKPPSSSASHWAQGMWLYFSGKPVKAAAALPACADPGPFTYVADGGTELAHKLGMKTRSWFTMNYMDSRNMAEETIKSMAAKVRTCAELIHGENREHLLRANVD